MEKSKYTSKSEIDKPLSVFETLKKDATNVESSLQDSNQILCEPIVTMSSLGKFARFGNQLFQYAFLKISAQKSGAKVECSSWIGQTLFGHNDATVSKLFPPAIERRDSGESLFDVVPELIPYIEKITGNKSSLVGSEVLNYGLSNCDLWGFFQVNTRLLEPHKEYFHSLFQPVSDLKESLEDGLHILRSKGKTIIGIHIRRGDFVTAPMLGFTLAVPSKWWCDWLDSIWSELDNPVLFLCSDDLENVVHDFDRFSPITSKDLNVKLPERMKDLNAEFYIDFFMLSNCDVVGISNSIFSFTASMMNECAKVFVRPHWDFSTKFTMFDPWNSEPLLYMGGQKSKVYKSFVDSLYVTYVTQDIFGLLKFIFVYFPISLAKRWLTRGYLGYQVQGFVGVLKSFFYTCGWRSVWK